MSASLEHFGCQKSMPSRLLNIRCISPKKGTWQFHSENENIIKHGEHLCRYSPNFGHPIWQLVQILLPTWWPHESKTWNVIFELGNLPSEPHPLAKQTYWGVFYYPYLGLSRNILICWFCCSETREVLISRRVAKLRGILKWAWTPSIPSASKNAVTLPHNQRGFFLYSALRYCSAYSLQLRQFSLVL